MCAADLCGETEASELKRFGRFAFQSQVKKYAFSAGGNSSVLQFPGPGDAWHMLETYARVSSSRAGKRYKDWLFHRAPEGDGWLDAVEAGCVLLMRDAVRELLRREVVPSFMTSMNRAVGDSGFTLEDLLPDELDVGSDVERREWEAIAKKLSAELFPDLDSCARIALWSRANGFSLNDERVLKWTKCSRSALYNIHRNAVEKICGEIKNVYPGEAPSAQLYLAKMVLEELGEMIAEKIFQEKRAARFFNKV